MFPSPVDPDVESFGTVFQPDQTRLDTLFPHREEDSLCELEVPLQKRGICNWVICCNYFFQLGSSLAAVVSLVYCRIEAAAMYLRRP